MADREPSPVKPRRELMRAVAGRGDCRRGVAIHRLGSSPKTRRTPRTGGRSVGSQDRRRMHPSECRSDRRGLGCGRRATNRSHRTISRHRCPVSTHEACRCQRSPETCRPQGGHSPRLPRRCDVAALAVAIARADERSRHLESDGPAVAAAGEWEIGHLQRHAPSVHPTGVEVVHRVVAASSG